MAGETTQRAGEDLNSRDSGSIELREPALCVLEVTSPCTSKLAKPTHTESVSRASSSLAHTTRIESVS